MVFRATLEASADDCVASERTLTAFDTQRSRWLLSRIDKTKPMAYLGQVGSAGLMTVVETPTFLAAAARCLSSQEKDDLIDFLARHPEEGVVMRGTGGVRKLRWAVGSKGKSGGIRVIYYFHSEQVPLFLLAAYPKSRKANLTDAEKNLMRQVIRDLTASFQVH